MTVAPHRPRDHVARAVHWYGAHHNAILFYSILLTLAAAPVLGSLRRDRDLLELFLAVNLSLAVLRREHGARRLAPALALAAVIGLRLVAAAIDAPTLRTVAHALWTGLALAAAAGTVRFALGGRGVDAEHLYAALSAYLLAGVFFGVLYDLMSRVWPASFAAGGVPVDLTPAAAIYFSFVTLATLGYGDIVPASDAARGVAVVEAVAGQLYVAVMIARLVSLYARRSDP
jgi:hypothetical protein